MIKNIHGRFVCYAVCLVFILSWSMTIYGVVFKSSGRVAYPASIYPTKNYVGPVAGPDFGQVYFSGKAWHVDESPFAPKAREFQDPLARMPAYSPFAVVLFSPLSSFEFRSALQMHLLVQLLVFLLLLAALCRSNPRALADCGALFSVTIFFSPIGITFLQMGQFDLYVAAAYLLGASLAAGDWPAKVKWPAYAFVGLLAGIKLTALPLLGFFTLWELFLKRSGAALAIWAAFALTIISFPRLLPEYLAAIKFWESGNSAGLSFHCFSRILYLPDWSVYAVFIALSAAATFFVWRKKNFLGAEQTRRYFLLFFLSLSIFSVGLGKVAYEYRQVGLLGAFCFFLLEPSHAHSKVHSLALWIFSAFFLVSLRLHPLETIDETIFAAVYLLTSLLLYYVAARSLTSEGRSPRGS